MKNHVAAWLSAGILWVSVEARATPPPASAFAALPEMSMVRLSPNGQRVAWANDPGGEPLVVVFDLATGKDLKRLQPANSRVRDLDWADDRTLIISVSRSLTAAATTIAEQRYEFERYLALDVEDPAGKARSLLMEHPERELVSGASLEHLHPQTPGTVIMSTYNFSGTAYRGEIGSRISGGRKDAGSGGDLDGPEAVDSIQKAVAKAFAGKSTYVFDRSADYKRILAEVESSASPPVYYLVDFGKGSADIIGEAYPTLADATLGVLESTTYKAADGYEIPAYLTLPPGLELKGLPLVVFPHGGPYSRDTGDFDWWAQFLATRGYVVLQPQFRGSTGFGADLYRAGHKQWGRGMQDDITAGVRHLVDRGIVDAARVCIVGGSYGGYAALAGAAFTPDVYACAVSVNGITDIPQMSGYIREHRGADSDSFRAWRDLIGDPSEQDIIAFSPSRSVETIRAPILLIHATEDTVVPPSQSRNFSQLLRQRGKAQQLIELPGEDHWLSTGTSRLTVLQSLETFLAVHLR